MGEKRRSTSVNRAGRERETKKLFGWVLSMEHHNNHNNRNSYNKQQPKITLSLGWFAVWRAAACAGNG